MLSTAQANEHADPPSGTWRACWFPVAFTVDVEAGRLYRAEVFDEGYVYFREPGGGFHAFKDRCPHRTARLSDGRLRQGLLECMYHGWLFASDGSCSHIPQLEAGNAIPCAASATPVSIVVRQGLVWIRGSQESADERAIPVIAGLDASCRSIDFAIDLPYGQEFLIENLIDYAHIHVAHDGVRGGGHSSLAGPLAFDLSPIGAGGFTAAIGRSSGEGSGARDGQPAAQVAFVAPNLVHYWTEGPRAGKRRTISGLALYSVPLGRGRCRLLYRAYGNSWPLRDRLRPRFWEHGFQCHLLEQDMAVVEGQAAAIARSGVPLVSSWLPLKSSDPLVLAYRRWLDKFDAERPDFVGLRHRGPASHEPPAQPAADRYHMHVRHCRSCARALRWAQRARGCSWILAYLALALATVAASGWNQVFAGFGVVALLAGLAAHVLCRRLAGRAGVLFPVLAVP